MKEKIEKNWSVILIFILGFTLALLIGRGWESKYIQDLMETNQTLGTKINQTEQILKNVQWNAEAVKMWQSLGYNVPMPKPAVEK